MIGSATHAWAQEVPTPAAPSAPPLSVPAPAPMSSAPPDAASPALPVVGSPVPAPATPIAPSPNASLPTPGAAVEPHVVPVPGPLTGFALPSPSAEEIARAQEIIHLRVRRQDLLASNRRWQVPAVGLGLGVSSLVIGGIVFATAWGYNDSCAGSDYSCGDFEYRRSRDVTGLIMMPLGAALVLTSVPMLIVRVVRHNRLKRVERSLAFLGQHASLGTSRGSVAFQF